ncbi:hypothetical protein N9B87_01740, partial [bacterium]|nr:hypothetical protein [bacterium]
WKMSENGGFVCKRKSSWCLRGCEGIKVLSGMRVPKMKGEGIAGEKNFLPQFDFPKLLDFKTLKTRILLS